MLTMSLLFVTNCIDAMLGAVTVRYLSDEPVRFHGLRSMLVFILFGATLSPFVVSFADAGIFRSDEVGIGLLARIQHSDALQRPDPPHSGAWVGDRPCDTER
jgi:hypothetical protein